MKLAFRLARHSDAEKLNILVNSAYRGESSKAGWTTEESLLGGQRTDSAGLRDQMDQPNAMIVLGEDENELRCCVLLEKHDDKCYLGMLTVQPNLQGSGIGKVLMNECEHRARAWSCSKIYMTVIRQRTELIAWYERRGYRKTGETKPFPYGDERFGLPKRDDLIFEVLEKTI